MPVTVFHSLSATTPDVTATNATVTAVPEIKPSNWNEQHVVSLALASNEIIKSVLAGTGSMSSGNLSFGNSNGISFGLNGSTLTASHNALTSQSVQTQGIGAIAAGGNTLSSGTLVFSNSNGLSFGLNAGTLTGSYTAPTQSAQSMGIYASSQTTGASSSSTMDARSLSVIGAGGVSVGLTGGALVISGAVGGGGDNSFNVLAAGTQTAGTATTVNFANSNGITFGMSGNAQITASHNALTSQSNQAFSAAGGSSSFQTLNFANSNGVSWSNSNGSIVASVDAGVASATIYAAENTTNASSSVVALSSFDVAGMGNISAGFSNGSLVISGASGAAQTITQYATGNTAGDASTGAQALSSIMVRGAGVASVGYSADGALIISVPAGGGGGDGANFLAAGTQTATTLGTVGFVDSNGVTFGMSASTRITASVRTDYASSDHSHAFSAPGGSSAFQTLNFANSFGVSWTNSGGSVMASVNTTYAASNHSHGNPTLALTNLSGTTASNSAGLTLSLSAAAGGGGADGGVFLSAAGSSQSAGNIILSNSNGVSFGMNGSTVTASHNGLTTAAASNHSHGFSAAGGSSAFQTLSFSNTNGVSFSNSNGQVVASVATTYAASNHSHGNPTLALTNLSGTTASASNGFTLSLSAAAGGGGAENASIYAQSNTTQSSSGTIALSSMQFAGAGAVSVGVSNGSVVMSAPPITSLAVSGALSISTDGASATIGVPQMSLYASSNTVGESSSSSFPLGPMSIRGAGIVSVGMSGGELLISASAAGAGDGFNRVSAGTQAAVTNGTVVFSNSNGISFGMSNSSVVTASHNGLTTAAASNHSHGNPTLNLTNLSGTTASASNGLTLSLSAASQTNQAIGIYGLSNTTGQSSSSTYDARSLSIRAYGIVSIGNSNGSLLISSPDAVDFTQLSVGNSNLGNTAGDTGVFTGRVVLVGSNNITLSGSSNGASATLSIIGGAGGGGAALSAGTQSVSTGTVVFSNSNGISFGMSGSSRITASHNGLTTAAASNHSHGNPTLALTNLTGTTASASNGLTLSLSGNAAQTNQTLGIYGLGNTTQSSSGTRDARSVSFNGLGGVSVGFSNGSIQLSAPAQSVLFAGAGISISTNGISITIMTV